MTSVQAEVERRGLFLLVVFVVAVAFRIALLMSGIVTNVYETNDSWQYLDMARSILGGHFAEGGVTTMNRTPGYPALLALVMGTVGESYRMIAGAQILLDALTCVLACHITMMLGLRRSAVLVTAALTVTCLFTSSFSYQVMTETPYTFFVVGAIWLVVLGESDRWPQTRRAHWCVLAAGAAFGVGILVRPALAPSGLLFAAALGVPAIRSLIARQSWLRRLLPPVLFSSGILLVVGPWMVRNFVTFHDEFTGPHRDQVTLLGRKCSIPNHAHFYSPQFQKLLSSYEEPFVQLRPFSMPVVARYVYPGEESELREALRIAEQDFERTGSFSPAHLDLFARIADKRRTAAPRLWVTAPATKIAKFWVTPRIAVLWRDQSGANSGRALVVGMTGYNLLYVVVGLIGLVLLLRRRPTLFGWYSAAMVVGHTWTYAIWLPFPTSRYAVALFPLLSVCGGLAAAELSSRLRLPKAVPVSGGAQAHR
jgi:hypothetical protein